MFCHFHFIEKDFYLFITHLDFMFSYFVERKQKKT